ncbi:AAA family ATPase [Bacillus sp. B-jedd]|uniref:AAA family ATPase n=1 Tax=Bacillus sp. B-jedd TaxID=1476857 RepID=UPI000515577E|nr:AAA family ATPase [Bacillus sp. B-jedd]CEG26347.1 topoisomerase-primase (TOPRIM) nucleotidyl transferase/hydrolase [Bacillus sp. B-jedd]
MNIKFVEIQNFRKLKCCRIEFTEDTTLFVGANNSGKTTAMEALIKFLQEKKFSVNDFTVTNWLEINSIGQQWKKSKESSLQLNEEELLALMPTLDVWIHVGDDEIHYVTHLIPSLDWKGGLIGVRLRLEPKDIQNLYKDFLNISQTAEDTVVASKIGDIDDQLVLWPRDLKDYISKTIQTQFSIQSYLLDPKNCVVPENGIAKPQNLPIYSERLDTDPFKNLFRVDYIRAQRGLTDNANDSSRGIRKGKLSAQLREYYDVHIDPEKSPTSSDIDALRAIEIAQNSFNEKLQNGFKDALSELETLGYPGFSNPKISLTTKLNPMDGLSHDSAVQFNVIEDDDQTGDSSIRLPEQYNGLGYQNLISIIFELMRFRDEWLRIGKGSKRNKTDNDAYFIPPLHLVLVEEPEAHLHIQVQQVFIRQAYGVLRNRSELLEPSINLTTQLVVSTHSSHIAYEKSFSSLRYFRRLPANSIYALPISVVINLSNVFGEGNETERFVTRYLQTTHSDLFFADAVILVEGPAERMLVPHFIRNQFKGLTEKYISLLEIGGSHAHRLRPLIEHLGITCLIVTDLDSVSPQNNNSAIVPKRNQGYTTNNDTLKTWLPQKMSIDELLNLNKEQKVKRHEDQHFAIRVAYQHPVNVRLVQDEVEVEALPYTFEDALVYENIGIFSTLDGIGLIKKFKNALNEISSITDLGEKLFNDLRTGKKAEFALDIIHLIDPKELTVPKYIRDGLSWLDVQLGGIEQNDAKEFVEEDVKEVVSMNG